MPVIISMVAAAAIIVPTLVYTALHPAAVTNTVKQLTHVAMPIKDIGRIAIVASRSTSTPQPSPSPAASPSPNAKKPTAAELAHQARLKHNQKLAVALLHTRKVASSGETSDVSAGAGTTTTDAANTTGDTSGATPATAAPASDTSSSTSNTTASMTAATAAPVATPATVAAVDQQPQADATPVYAPEVVVDARFVHQAQPDYPEIAKEQNAQGTAVVFATVGPKGNVLSTRIDESTGNKMLDQAAMAAARQSSFEPPQINGKPATETYRLVYTFAL